MNPITTWAPLLIVFAVACAKEATDDAKRAAADAVANSRPYTLWREGRRVADCAAETIRVGDLVQVNDDDEVPCDLLLLKTADVVPEGVAYLSTANLDGETDLKGRRARPETFMLTTEEAAVLRGRVECEPPNAELYRFDATLTLVENGNGDDGDGDGVGSRTGGAAAFPRAALHGGGELAISGEQLLQHGTVLRKTGWAIGLVVYTGADTKMSQNRAGGSPTKVSSADRRINDAVVRIFLVQLALVVLLGLLGFFWGGNGNTGYWYLGWGREGGGGAEVGAPNPAPAPSDESPPAAAAAALLVEPGAPTASDLADAWGKRARLLASLVGIRGAAAPVDAAAASAADASTPGLLLGSGEGAGGDAGLPWYTHLVLPLRFLLLSSMMIPISLKVSLDIVKVFYARLVVNDAALYDEDTDTPAAAANTAVAEDLGSLHTVLTDKTGTLTENIMTLAAVSIAGEMYGHFPEASSSPSAPPPATRPVSAELADARLLVALAGGRPEALDFFRALALCNTVKPEHVNAVPLSAVQERWSERSGGGRRGSVGGVVEVPGAPGSAPHHLKLIPERDAEDEDGDGVGLLSSQQGHAAFLAPPAPPTLERGLSMGPSLHPVPDSPASATSGAGEASGAGFGVGISSPSSFAAASAAVRGAVLRRRLVQFASSSPDEEALSHAAARLGVALSHRAQLRGSVQRVTLRYNTDIIGCGVSAAAALGGRGAGGTGGRTSSGGSTLEEELMAGLGDDDPAAKRVWVCDTQPEATYDVLHVLPFTSDRKRMSVLVRRVDGGLTSSSAAAGAANPRIARAAGAPSWSIEGPDLVLITKGADDVMRPRLSVPPATEGLSPFAPSPASPSPSHVLAATEDHLESFAGAGLRTLLVAARPVSSAEYDAWKPLWDRACGEVGARRDDAVAAACEAIETRLHLLGATAIEDRLQDGVPESIAELRAAGIGVWMLTGDKYSTALQIAQSARLLPVVVPSSGPGAAAAAATAASSSAARIVSLRGQTAEDVDRELAEAGRVFSVHASQTQAAGLTTAEAPDTGTASHALLVRAASFSTSASPLVLVAEGHALRFILADSRHASAFTSLAFSAGAVVCCRCTPSQKAALVSCVRARGKVALAVGDGGNDVAMIQAANVGVGIAGREGQQAARASDYAVGRFRHLVPLILLHGRWAAHRTSLLAHYTIYKSAALALLQLLANSSCGFSGCSLLDTYALTTYNLVYTAVPGLALALDKDRPAAELRAMPAYYTEASGGAWYGPMRLAAWGGRALYQALVVYGVCVGLLAGYPSSSDGSAGDAAIASTAAFSALVLAQFITLATEVQGATVYTHVLNLGGAALFVTLLLVRNVWPESSGALGVVSDALAPTGSAVVFAVLLALLAATLPFIALRAWTKGQWAGGASSVSQIVTSSSSFSTTTTTPRSIISDGGASAPSRPVTGGMPGRQASGSMFPMPSPDAEAATAGKGPLGGVLGGGGYDADDDDDDDEDVGRGRGDGWALLGTPEAGGGAPGTASKDPSVRRKMW